MLDPGRAGVALTCPVCDAPLSAREGALRCPDCRETVPVVDGIAHFPVDVGQPGVPPAFDALSRIYETPFWFPVVYRLLGGPRAPSDDRATLAGALDAVGDDVLDAACGTGRVTRYLARDAASVWGIDLSIEMLQRARRSAAREGLETVAFARMNAEDLRFAAEAFDSVICGWALHLFASIPTALAEMHRVLTPGGRLAGTTLSADAPLTLPGVQYALRRTIGARVFDGETLRTLFLEAGFRTVHLERYGAALFFSAEK